MCLKVKVEHFLYFCHSFLIAQGKNKCIGNDVTGLLKNEKGVSIILNEFLRKTRSYSRTESFLRYMKRKETHQPKNDKNQSYCNNIFLKF